MSYDDSDLSELNRARAALGDTSNNAATELLTDDHIELIISEDGYNAGVASLAGELAARYARKPSAAQLPGGLGATWGERIKQWNLVVSQYQALAATESQAASAPLTSRAATVATW